LPPRKEVPTEETGCQTDIAMDYFEKQHLQKQESRGSGETAGGSRVKVGGGGTISKPPKTIKQANQSKPGVDQMTLNGVSHSEISNGSKQNAS
jgi:hypothetical protein